MLIGVVAVSTAATLPAESSSSLSTTPLTSSPSLSPAEALGPRKRTLVVDPREEVSKLGRTSHIVYYESVEEAVSAATEGDVVALVPGTEVHSGRAILSKPGITLTTLGFDLNDDDDDEDDEKAAFSSPSGSLSKEEIQAASGPRNTEGEKQKQKKMAMLHHETKAPYESTVSISAPRCRVIGLEIRHSSPSVANNYAIHVEESASSASSLTVISDCDVASSSGTALGLDAGASVSRSRLDSKSRFGAAVFAPGPPRTKLFRCELVGGGGGLLVRGGDVEVRECSLSGEPLALKLADGSGVVSGCVVLKGKVEEGAAWEGEVL